jgi:hypothetical protein
MRKEAGTFAAKHPNADGQDPRIAEAVKAKAVGGEFSCFQAERLAAELQVPMSDIGIALDLLEIRIAQCQLGLFGYSPESRIVKPASSVSPELEKAIRQALVNNRLPCIDAWSLAEAKGLKRMAVAEACESLKLKVKPCQLGAF